MVSGIWGAVLCTVGWLVTFDGGEVVLCTMGWLVTFDGGGLSMYCGVVSDIWGSCSVYCGMVNGTLMVMGVVLYTVG